MLPCAARNALVATALLAMTARADDADVLKLKVTALKRVLENGSTEEKIKAAGDLAKLGEDGKPAAKPLAKMCVDPSARVSQPAMDALASVWPELHRAGTILLKDKKDEFSKSPNRVEACDTILKLGDGADAAVPFLVQSLRAHIESDDDFFGLNTGL